jgi:hypothetical protein
MAIKWRKDEPLAYELIRLMRDDPGPKRKAKAPLPPAKRRERRSDLVVAALGITLGLICALFPWYIFFNQDEFGIRALKFTGTGGNASGPVAIGPQPERVGAPMSVDDMPELELDLFATGTLPTAGDSERDASRLALEQPFPVEEPFFKVIHVENGRAMIEDESGLWVVQRGSKLPDNTRVTGIEERDGRWVLVTSADRIIEVTP